MSLVKKWLGRWNAYEIVWLLAFCAVAVTITIASHDSFFGFSVFLSGVLCVILAAKGNIANYVVGTFNTVGYAWLSWQNGLFGEVGLNLLFYLPMNIIGFLMWRRHLQNGTVSMRKLTAKMSVLAAAACALGIAALGFSLSLIGGQNTPYIDAATNMLSIASTILMIRRYREQWAGYIVLNVLSVIMWAIRASNGSPEGPLMVVMWSAYLINAFYGLYNWTRGAKKTEKAA